MIPTDLSAGTQAHVYRFDGETGQFSLIAANLTVGNGGAVTYRNNTLSEYLITSQLIPGALISDVIAQQEIPKGKSCSLISAIIGLFILGGVWALWIQTRRWKGLTLANGHVEIMKQNQRAPKK